jgi:hypothetical protein
MTEDYKPNSHLAREQKSAEHPPIPERRAQKVVTGEVSQRKKTGLSKAASTFLPGDVNSVKSYILMDVLVPSIKRAISDIVCNGINMLLGEPSRGKSASAGAKVSYRQYYQDRDDRRDYARPRAQTQYSYDDVIFQNRGDAEEVLFRMEELLDRFDAVSVADLFDMAGISCNYTDNKYGWTDLSSAQVERVRDGYVIRLPRATSL